MMLRVELTASAALVEISPCAVWETLSDLRPHNDSVGSADVLDFIIYRQHLHATDLHEEREHTDLTKHRHSPKITQTSFVMFNKHTKAPHLFLGQTPVSYSSIPWRTNDGTT